MNTAIRVVQMAELLVFASASLAALARWRRRGERAGVWLSGGFGALALIVLSALVLPRDLDGMVGEWSRKAVAMVVLVFPYFLFRFTATFDRPSRAVMRVATGPVLVFMGWTLVMPSMPAPGNGARPAWALPYGMTFFATWTLLSALSAARLWRGGHSQPTVARRRMWTLALGSVVLNIALFVTAAARGGPPSALRLTGQSVALAAGVLFAMGFSLPPAVRTLWRQREVEAFRRAEAGLMTAMTEARVAEVILPHAMRLTAGGGALMTDGRQALGRHGLTDDEADALAALLAALPPHAIGVHVVAPGVVAVPVRDGWLAVQSSPYTPFFGREELSLLESLGRSAALALERLSLSERERASRRALEERERQLAHAQALASLGSWEWDVATGSVWWSDQLRQIFGIAPDDDHLSFGRFLGMVHPDDRRRTEVAVDETRVTGRPFELHFRAFGDGGIRWIFSRGQALHDADGRIVRLRGTAQDVTAQMEAQQELAARARQQAAVARLGQRALTGGNLNALLQQAAQLVRDVLDVEYAAVFRSLGDGQRLQLRAGVGWAAGLTGLATIPAGTGTQGEFSLTQDEPVVFAHLAAEARFTPARLLLDHEVVSGASAVVAGAAQPVGVLAAYSRRPRAFSDHDTDFLQSMANVIATAVERHRAEDDLAHQAFHDALTGLPNRALLLDRLDQALTRARRRRSLVTVLFLDLDRFKVVNDGLGHSAGDELLVAVARRLSAIVRPSDTVARFGGDEFVVVSEDGRDLAEAAVIAERIADCLETPIEVAGRQVPVTVSIGIVLATPDQDAEAVLRDADATMYQAKERGRARYEVFDTTMRARVVARLETEAALRGALDRDELEVRYQPEVSLADGRIVGVESLVRWAHPERGLLTPDAFLPSAEETGLVVAIDTWVLRQACRRAVEWDRHAGPAGGPIVWVNLSARTLTQPDLPSLVARVIAEEGVPDTRVLGVEITEGGLMADIDTVGAALAALKALGLHLAVDDFGTGFSSLSYLKRFPVDVLKVDQSFVAGLGTDAGDSAIVRAVVGLAHSLGLAAVAEGVETDAQLRALRSLSCDAAQGWHLGLPMAGDEVGALLRLGRPAASRAG